MKRLEKKQRRERLDRGLKCRMQTVAVKEAGSVITTISSMFCSLHCCSWPGLGINSSIRWRGHSSLQPAWKHTHSLSHIETNTIRQNTKDISKSRFHIFKIKALVRHGIHLVFLLIDRLMFLWPAEPNFSPPSIPLSFYPSLLLPPFLPLPLPIFIIPVSITFLSLYLSF